MLLKKGRRGLPYAIVSELDQMMKNGRL